MSDVETRPAGSDPWGPKKAKKRRLLLGDAAACRKALVRLLRDYWNDAPESRDHAFFRNATYCMSILLADWRKETELALSERVTKLEEAAHGYIGIGEKN